MTNVTEIDVTYLLIDGENLDATLGGSILGRKPTPDDRPRWEKVVTHIGTKWGGTVKTLFFINASSGSMHMPFVQALQSVGIRPIPLRGPADVKVVDEGIKRTLTAIVERPGNVVLGSHDIDYIEELKRLLVPTRQVGILGFTEFISTSYLPLVAAHGLEIIDLERDTKAFSKPLQRVRIMNLDEFDPDEFL